MKVLVVPDIHLKPAIFTRAADIAESKKVDNIVVLGDIADDFHQNYNMELYLNTFKAAADFAKQFPESLWCYGNHDVSYEWEYEETGYSPMMKYAVTSGLQKIRENLKDPSQLTFVHRIDNCIFSHAGIIEWFVEQYVPKELWKSTYRVIKNINEMPRQLLWTKFSPIWVRLQFFGHTPMWRKDKYLQVVGHTPIEVPYEEDVCLSCDTFSTYSDGTPYGNESFVIVDTVTKQWEIVK